MTREPTRRIVPLLSWGTSLALLVTNSLVLAERPSPPRVPNIVYILSDDQAYGDYGFMGNKLVHTPNLDRLAQQSARYVNAYVSSSVCRPSLASLLTGLYPHQHGIHFNHPPPGFRELGKLPTARAYYQARQAAVDLFRRSPTFPAILSSAGYVSFQSGKHWEGAFHNGGFDEGMTINQPCFEQPWNRRLASGEWVAHGNGDAGLPIGRKTMQPVFEFLDRNTDRPFLLWYAPVLPHEPHNAPARYRKLVEERSDVPRRMIGYYANIAWFDDTIGQLLGYLDRKGLSENTLFVYVCDNGWTTQADSPKQDKRSKRSPFENGVRTPILLRWDGVIKPATHTGLVNSIDLVPTLLRAAKIDPGPYHLPGIDLLPSATGRAELDPDRPVFGEIYPGDGTSLGHPETDIAYRWVRQRNLKLIVPHVHNSSKPWNKYVSQVTLYDLSRDPDETTNLASDPTTREDVTRLRRLLDDWWLPSSSPGSRQKWKANANGARPGGR